MSPHTLVLAKWLAPSICPVCPELGGMGVTGLLQVLRKCLGIVVCVVSAPALQTCYGMSCCLYLTVTQ